MISDCVVPTFAAIMPPAAAECPVGIRYEESPQR